jgi:hypothetical protein
MARRRHGSPGPAADSRPGLVTREGQDARIEVKRCLQVSGSAVARQGLLPFPKRASRQPDPSLRANRDHSDACCRRCLALCVITGQSWCGQTRAVTAEFLCPTRLAMASMGHAVIVHDRHEGVARPPSGQLSLGFGAHQLRGSPAGPSAPCRRARAGIRAAGKPARAAARPWLHDSRGLRRAGDSLILFTDGVTEARSHIGLPLRRRVAPRLHRPAAPPVRMGVAEAIQLAMLSSSSGTVCPFSGRACR